MTTDEIKYAAFCRSAYEMGETNPMPFEHWLVNERLKAARHKKLAEESR
jgi:hypothetical protein